LSLAHCFPRVRVRNRAFASEEAAPRSSTLAAPPATRELPARAPRAAPARRDGEAVEEHGRQVHEEAAAREGRRRVAIHDSQRGAEPSSAQARGLPSSVHPEGHPPEVRAFWRRVASRDGFRVFFFFSFVAATMRVEGGRDERRPSNHHRSPPPPPSFLPLRRRAIPPPAIPAAHSRASREPKKKHKGQGKTYYHVKDINFLAHEPLLDKFRALRAYERKIKKAKARSHHAGPRTTASAW